MKSISFCILATISIGLPATTSAQATDESLKEAQNRAALAQANATAQTALAQAQATLTKAQIENIQGALSAVDPSKVKIGPVTAPKLTATSYKAFVTELAAWKPLFGELNRGDTVIWLRSSIGPTIETYRAVSAQIVTSQEALDQAAQDFDEALKPGRAGGARATFIGSTVIGAVAIANLATSFAAAWKPQYGFDSQHLESTQGLVEAYIQSSLMESGVKIIEPDAAVDFCYNLGNFSIGVPRACKESISSEDLGLIEDAEKLKSTLKKAREHLAKVKIPPPPQGKDAVDPYKEKRSAIASYSKVINDAQAALNSIFTPTSANIIPFMIALQGAHLSHLLSNEGAYLLSVKVQVSDVDTIARDKLFSRYKVGMLAYSVVEWELTNSAGEVKKFGVKELGGNWTKVDLPW